MVEKTKYHQISELYKIIATPLIATVDADFYAANRFIEYVRKYGFDYNSEYDWGRLKTITFKYTTTNTQGVQQEHILKIPVISLIPLPLLQVEKASFDMDIRILGVVFKEENGNGPPNLIQDANKKKDHDLGKINATLTPINEKKVNQLSPNLTANLKVKLDMHQADMPGGISQLLSITQEASSGTIITLRDTISLKPSSMTLQDTTPVSLKATLSDHKSDPVAQTEIYTRVEKYGEFLEIKPKSAHTDATGQAIFEVSMIKAPDRDETTEISFWGGSALAARCKIIIKGKNEEQ